MSAGHLSPGQRHRLELAVPALGDVDLAWAVRVQPLIDKVLGDGPLRDAFWLVAADGLSPEEASVLLDVIPDDVEALVADALDILDQDLLAAIADDEGLDADEVDDCALAYFPSGSTPAAGIARAVRRLGEFLASGPGRAAISMAPDGPRPGGTVWVEVGAAATALVDAVTLEVVDVDGTLLVVAADIAGVPGVDSTPAAEAVGELAAVRLALEEVEGIAVGLLRLQEAAALAAPSLEDAIDAEDRALAWQAAAAALDAVVALPHQAVLLGIALDRLDGDLGERVRAAAAGAGTDAFERAATAFRERAEELLGELTPTKVHTGRSADSGSLRARALARRAAVAQRRGSRSAALWMLAIRAWEELDADEAERCRIEASRDVRVWTWDVILGGRR